MASRTRRPRVLETPGSPFTTLETVFKLTPATAATSRMVGRRPSGCPRRAVSSCIPAVSGSWLSMPAAPLGPEIDIPLASNLPRGCGLRSRFDEAAPSGFRSNHPVTESSDLA
ncbi:hypothetical protein GCM10027456_10390 [Kineosporia babensis]